MNESTLLRLALTCIIVGIPLLYVVTDAFPTNVVPTSTLSGTVANVQHKNGTTITLTKTIILPEAIDIKTGATVKAKGHWDGDVFRANEIKVT